MSSRLAMAVLALALVAPGCSSKPTPATPDETAIHGLGIKLGEGLVPFELSERELQLLQAGLAEAVHLRAAPVDPSMADALGALMARRTEVRKAKELARGPAFLQQAAKEPGATTLDSGIVYRELVAGTGAAVAPATRAVRVHLKGTLADGSLIEDTHLRGNPIVLPMGESVPRCWSTAFTRLKVGGKAHVVCPPAVAFGDLGRPPVVAPGATVAYDVELVELAE
jgi:FKBP-type peptidyl-prolyl cis-trans isomerase FkpA